MTLTLRILAIFYGVLSKACILNFFHLYLCNKYLPMFVPGTLLETTDTGQRKLPGLVKFSLVGEEGVSRDVDLLAV